MTKALDCGGMLLVIAEENVAFIIMPRIRREAGILFPNSSSVMVSLPATKRIVSFLLWQLKQSEYVTVTSVVSRSRSTESMMPLEKVLMVLFIKERSIDTCIFFLVYGIRGWELCE